MSGSDRTVDLETTADRTQVVKAEIDGLEKDLATLRANPAFKLGDRLIRLVSPRRTPSLSCLDLTGLSPEVQLAQLQFRREELVYLLSLTRASLRLRVGEDLLDARRRPWRAPLGLARLTGLLGAGLVNRFSRRFHQHWQPIALHSLGGGEPGWPETRAQLRVCVYGEMDPSLIDGATIWLASLIEVLAGFENVRTTVLLSAPLRRRELLGHLIDHPRVRLVEVTSGSNQYRGCLHPVLAVRALDEIDGHRRQDIFIVRGRGAMSGWNLLDKLVGRRDLAARAWAYLVDPNAYATALRRVRLARVARAVRWMICQTPEAREMLVGWLGASASERIRVIGPMIPHVASKPRHLETNRPPRLVYSGKFSPPYRILEMLESFARIRQMLPGAEFHVVGDKFHNQPPVPEFKDRVIAALKGPGVHWHGGLSRAEALAIVAAADIATSWRDGSFDESLELATKVLEYAACGLPVVLNPTRMHRRILGENYPGFASTQHDFETTVLRLFHNARSYNAASKTGLETACGYDFVAATKSLEPVLADAMQVAAGK